MEIYRAYHVDIAGKTLGHLSFESEDDTSALGDAAIIQRTGKWPTIELWSGTREIECSLQPNSASL
jgi:hypothetical protein